MNNSSIQILSIMLEVCPGNTEKTTTLLADSGINDRLRSLIDQTCFEFVDVS